jgi:hypothetical protein
MTAKKQNTPRKETKRQQNTGDNPDVKKAHDEADEDISQDPDFNATSPNDDLDEEESARLGDDKTDIV